MKEWTCPGLRNVMAYTKSEARTLFKTQLRELERLTFQPQSVTRLPIKTIISMVKT